MREGGVGERETAVMTDMRGTAGAAGRISTEGESLHTGDRGTAAGAQNGAVWMATHMLGWMSGQPSLLLSAAFTGRVSALSNHLVSLSIRECWRVCNSSA